MCRLLALCAGPSPSDREEGAGLPSLLHLVSAPHSLRRQAAAGRVPPGDAPGHHDSWGIGWFDAAGQPSLWRQTGSACDSDLYNSAAEAARSARLLIGHLRKASVGAVTRENAHPIRVDTEGGRTLLLAHNGTLRPPLLESLRAEVAEAGRDEARSDNDTVVLSAWLALRTARAKTPGEALAEALQELLCRADALTGGEREQAYSGLNLLVAFSDELYAFRWCSKNEHYYTLHRRQLPGGGWVVASEPTDSEPGWEPLPLGRLLRLAPTPTVQKVIQP